LDPDRPSYFQVDLLPENTGQADGDRRLVLADLSVTTARKPSVFYKVAFALLVEGLMMIGSFC
jgi:hypothetical protein